jgi:AraC-like DNA-binding protein
LGKPDGPSVTVFRPIVHGLTALGLDWRSLLESCGIEPDLLGDPEARIPAEVFEHFWRRSAEITGDPCFGLHVGERVRPLAVNIIGYLLMSSDSVRHGLERVARFQRLVFNAEWIALVDQGSSTLIRFRFQETDAFGIAVRTEYMAALVLKFLDWITAAHIRPGEVRFRHPPAGERSEYERILGCPVKFQHTDSELVMPQVSLDEPSVYGNPEIARLHEEHAERHLAALEDQSITRKVKTILLSHLDRGPCELRDAARSLHMSPRTLQRRLADEGATYNDTLDAVRRELCLHHLESTHAALAEIAYIAGFSGESAFSRAVRRWTGQTPREYRQAHGAKEPIWPR